MFTIRLSPFAENDIPAVEIPPHLISTCCSVKDGNTKRGESWATVLNGMNDLEKQL
jgi:hypothetical protein